MPKKSGSQRNSMVGINSRWVVIILVISMVILLCYQPVYAVTITVNTTEDELNEDGDCSLREAIQAANTDSAVDACVAGNGEDTINLSAGSYLLSIAGAEENENQSGDLDIKDDLIIIGEGVDESIVDGNGIDRVFQIDSGVRLDIYHVKIAHGKTPDYRESTGGGIYNEGDLSLFNCIIFENHTGLESGSGGGIWNSGDLIVERCTIDKNHTGESWESGVGGSGGGIFNSGKATLSYRTIRNNYTSWGEDIDDGNAGGGILNTGVMTITMSTISGNFGGQPDLWCGLNESEIIGSNLKINHQNSVSEHIGYPGEGGGIWNSGTMRISFSTIAMNKTGFGCRGEFGGGIYNEGTAVVGGSLLAMNTDASRLVDSDCYGEFDINGYNYVRAIEGCDLGGYCCQSESGLYSLADNGGETLTHGITNDIYVNLIPDGESGCGTEFQYDQRDLPRLVNSGCDIGSFELQEGEIPTAINLLEFQSDDRIGTKAGFIIGGITISLALCIFIITRYKSQKS